MGKGWALQIISLESVDSTQRYLIDGLKSGEIIPPAAVTAKRQTFGKGSRDNRWIGYEGNLFLSFAIQLSALPKDLKLESASIYFSYLLKETLAEAGSKIWLKWPNDLYIEERKIGGVITNLIDDAVICGIGLNCVEAPEGFGTLDVSVIQSQLLETYFCKINKSPGWKQIFSKYELEFDKCRVFCTHRGEGTVLLEKAILMSDGSINCDGQRMYSLR